MCVCAFQGAFAAVEVVVRPGDGIKAEGGRCEPCVPALTLLNLTWISSSCHITSVSWLVGVMVTLDHSVDIDTHTEGGLGNALCLGCCTGESFFFSHFG